MAFRTSSSYFLQEPKAFLQFLTAVDTSEPIAFKKRWLGMKWKKEKKTNRKIAYISFEKFEIIF